MEMEMIWKLIIGGGGTGAGGLLWKKVLWPAFKKQREEAAARWKKLDDIHKEMQLDGNGSMKTALFNLKNTTDKILWRVDGIEESQKLAMNVQNLAYWLADEEGECIYVSPCLCKLLGRTEHDLLGNNWISWVVPNDKERVFDSWNFSVDNVTVFDEHYIFKRADGKLQQVWGLAFPKLVQGKHAGVMGRLEPVGEAYQG